MHIENANRSVTVYELHEIPRDERSIAVEKLRELGLKGARITLSDGSVATYKGGPFQSVEIVSPS